MSDGTSNVTEVDSIDVTVATIPNLDVLTNYTLYVTAFTETGCETGPTSVYITVMESECRIIVVLLLLMVMWCSAYHQV